MTAGRLSWGQVRRMLCFFFFQAEDGIRDRNVTGVQTCALPIYTVGANRVDEGAKIVRLHLRPGVLLQHRIGRIEVQTELVLDVDDERVDLRRVGDADEVLEPARIGREAEDVEPPRGKRPLDQRVENGRSGMLTERDHRTRNRIGVRGGRGRRCPSATDDRRVLLMNGSGLEIRSRTLGGRFVGAGTGKRRCRRHRGQRDGDFLIMHSTVWIVERRRDQSNETRRQYPLSKCSGSTRYYYDSCDFGP